MFAAIIAMEMVIDVEPIVLNVNNQKKKKEDANSGLRIVVITAMDVAFNAGHFARTANRKLTIKLNK